jgi:hypothetical protein
VSLYLKSSTETAKASSAFAAYAIEMRPDPKNRPVNRPALARACKREAWRIAMARSPPTEAILEDQLFLPPVEEINPW